MDRTFVVAQTSYNRLIASQQQHQALLVPFEENKEVSLDLLLDAQRRLMESESRYFRALAEYAIATKNVHYVKGTLLDYDGVYLAEGPWPGEAHRDAADMESLRGDPRKLNYASSRAPVVGWGEMPQNVAGVSHESLEEIPVEQLPREELVEPTSALVPAKVEDRSASQTVNQAGWQNTLAPAPPAPTPAALPKVSPKRLPPSPPTSTGK
jgi:hypothetical protein